MAPNSPDLNPLDYHVRGAMLERYKVFTPKPTNKAELMTALEATWEDLPQEAIDLAVLAFRKRLQLAFEQMEVTLNIYSNRIGSINKRPFSGPKINSKRN